MRLLTAAITAASILIAAPAAAQQTAEQKEVLATLDKFFDGMTRRDTALSRAVLLPGSVFYATMDGKTRGTSDTSYIASLAKGGGGKMVERIHKPSVYVHGPVAEVWTEYEFLIDGKRSHCGIDSFTFVQTATGWRMATAVYSIQRDGCPTLPTGSD